jgi:hypothetical protein
MAFNCSASVWQPTHWEAWAAVVPTVTASKAIKKMFFHFIGISPEFNRKNGQYQE